MNGRLPIMRVRSLRSMLVIGLLLVNTSLVYLIVQRRMTMLLFLLVGLSLGLTFLRWPPLGLIAAILSGIFVPFVGPSGFNVTMVLVAMLLGLWLLDIIVRQRRAQFVSSRTVWSLLAFLAAALFSFGIGQLPWFAFALHAPLGAQLGGLSVIVLSAGVFLLAANQVRDTVWLSRITWAFLAIAVMVIVLGSGLPKLGFPTQRLIQQVGSVYYIWVVAMAFSQAAFNRDLHPAWRFVLAGLVLVTLYDLTFLRFVNKSGWVPALVCVVAIIGLRYWRVALALAPVAALAAVYFSSGLIASDEYSAATRLDAWMIMVQIIKVNPVWGVGFANYYWYTPLFPIRGYAVNFNSHNNYVDIVAQTGLVGLACFMWFLWEVGRLGWRLRNNVTSGFAQAYVYGALGGLAATVVAGMFGDWVLPFFYNIGLRGFRTSMLAWLFLGGLVSLGQMAKSPKSRSL